MRATPSSSTAQRSGSEPGPAHLLSGGRSRAALSIALSSALVAFAAGCGGDQSDPPTDPGNQTTHSPQLKFFVGDDACAQLESHIETSVETTLRKQFEGWRRSRSDAASGVAAPVESPAQSAPPPASAAPAAESFSSTTVRSAGVDEPDPVKNDGRRVFTLKRTSDAVVLSRVDLGAAGAMTLGSQVRWPSPASEGADPFESPSGLYLLDEARVVALTTSGAHWGPWTDGPWMPVPAATAVPQIAAKTSLCQGACGDADATPPSVHLRLVDAAGTGLPTRWEVRLDGSLVGSRRIGDKVHLVTRSELQLPDGIKRWPAVDWTLDDRQWNADLDREIEDNARLIRTTALSTWLAPLAAGSATALSQPPTSAECASFGRIDGPTRPAWLHVATVDLATRTVSRHTALADASGLYMSAHSLILSTPRWNPGERVGETYLHRFVPDADGRFQYHGSGRIEGTLINDYAIDESSPGLVRVAASSFSPNDLRTFTYLATLEPAAAPQTMRQLGRTGPIASGETLRSARFLGDRAYLVTFRQIDPFFVYDLSDPAQPTALGELKIPGFSTFLFPAGSNHVLGIGYDGGGWPRRVKASLFDVTEPTRPLEQSTLLLGDSYTESDALWDPHAFTWYSPPTMTGELPGGGSEGTMAIPLRSYASWYGTQATSGIRVVSVRPSRGASALSSNGTLSMDDLLDAGERGYAGWRNGDARRAVFVGSHVYAIADAAVRSAPVATPASPIATVSVP